MKSSERIRDADEQRLILTGGWEREGGRRKIRSQINSSIKKKNDRDPDDASGKTALSEEETDKLPEYQIVVGGAERREKCEAGGGGRGYKQRCLSGGG